MTRTKPLFIGITAAIALSNLKFLKELSKNKKFAKLTGG